VFIMPHDHLVSDDAAEEQETWNPTERYQVPFGPRREAFPLQREPELTDRRTKAAKGSVGTAGGPSHYKKSPRATLSDSTYCTPNTAILKP